MKAILKLLLAILATIVSAWTLALLWKWFVATPFHLPEITPAHAIGLAMLSRLPSIYTSMKLQLAVEGKLDKDKEWILSAVCIGFTPLILGLGYLYVLFMKAGY